jgi:hypothetical protein
LIGGENFVRLGRRHDVIGISRSDAADKRAFAWFAGNDGGLAVFARQEGVFEAIEPEIGFAGGGIRAVARETVFGKNGPNVAIISDSARSEALAGKQKGQKDAADFPTRLHYDY